jgi:hypothetical protein
VTPSRRKVAVFATLAVFGILVGLLALFWGTQGLELGSYIAGIFSLGVAALAIALTRIPPPKPPSHPPNQPPPQDPVDLTSGLVKGAGSVLLTLVGLALVLLLSGAADWVLEKVGVGGEDRLQQEVRVQNQGTVITVHQVRARTFSTIVTISIRNDTPFALNTCGPFTEVTLVEQGRRTVTDAHTDGSDFPCTIPAWYEVSGDLEFTGSIDDDTVMLSIWMTGIQQFANWQEYNFRAAADAVPLVRGQ